MIKAIKILEGSNRESIDTTDRWNFEVLLGKHPKASNEILLDEKV